MEKLSLKELAVPVIKAIDSCNYLLKSIIGEQPLLPTTSAKKWAWTRGSCSRWSYLLPFMM